jgi:DnaJ-class molecular chaperone
LGGEVEVPTLDRPVRLTIPPLTANNKKFRLSGLGLPNIRKPEKRGYLYAIVDVRLPTKLSKNEKELFERLRELRKPK